MIEIAAESKDLLEEYDGKIRLYQAFMDEVDHQIRSILQVSQINCNAITTRLKSRESVEGKVERKQGKYARISDITDIAGVRIITYYSEDVDRIAEIIEKEFDVDQENSIDKRESLEPDRFGYCSVHYVVRMSADRLKLPECQRFSDMKCEIQIRTVLQHAWAEIEHDIGYKSEITIPREMRRDFSRIAGLLEIADKEFDQIRQALIEYKDNAQTQITDAEFLDRELDAVILEVMLNSNTEIKALGQHISKTVGLSLDKIEGDGEYRSTINRLNWVGIKTVRELNEALSKYSESAMKIADEKLKKYATDKPDGRISGTIALFYLCYAVLLANARSEEDVYQYFDETDIALPEKRRKAAGEIFSLKRLL